MAINFNKLFLQNLLPKSQSSAHAQAASFGNSDSNFNEDGNLENSSDEYDGDSAVDAVEQQDQVTERLTQTLDSLRKIIEKHNHGRGIPRSRLELPSTLRRPSCSGEAPSPPFNHGHRVHRRPISSHQPYQVDAAPVCKDISDPQQSRMNERLSKKSEKVIVEVRVVFLKIGEIDTLKEMYRADAFIQTKWPEPRLNGKTAEDLAKIDFSKCWNPLVYIENILTESKDQHWLVAKENEKGQVMVTERRRLKAIFLETLELNDFPLDVQDLTITLSSERPDTEVDLMPDNTDLCGINLQTFVDQQEWRLHEHIEITKQSVVQEFTSSSQKHPCISVTCRAARRPGYFYWNVFLIMFFITGLSFATFAVSAERPENRLQLSFTLFLTSVAFKFVINQSLPKISYLTFMDKYVLMSLGILCIVSVWHAIVTLVPVYSLPDPSLPKYGSAGPELDWSVTSLFPTVSLLGDQPSAEASSSFPSAASMSQLIDLFGQLPLLNVSLRTSGNNPQILLPRSMIPSWMNESFTEALQTDTSEITGSSNERDLAILQRAIDITLKRRLRERRKYLQSRQDDLKRLEDERTSLLNRVERDVFIVFCIFYIACHLLFIFAFYFGANKRRRKMVEYDKQFRTWLRKRRENPSASGPQPFVKTGPCISQTV